MTKTELKDRILELLGGETLGMTKSKLADNLGASRPTVSKYVDILHEEGRIKRMAVGEFKFWALAKKRETRDSPLKMSFRIIIDLVLEYVCRYTNHEVNWKEFGQFIGKNLDLSKIVQTDFFFDLIYNESGDDSVGGGSGMLPPSGEVLLQRLSKIFLEMFKAIVTIFDECIIDEPIIIHDPAIITLRLHDTAFNEYKKVFEIVAGLVEQKMRTDFYDMAVTIDFNEPVKTDILDIIIKIHDLDKLLKTLKEVRG
ncbi:MAG: hypothetical protein ACTSUE_09750 [Promethearchaeota archaeon]